MNDTEKLAVIIQIILETIAESMPNGAPASSLYLPLSEKGCTLDNFNLLMSFLLSRGEIECRHDCYFITR